MAAAHPLHPPATPPQTPPVHETRFIGWNAGPDPVIGLHEYDQARDWDLPLSVQRAVGGASRGKPGSPDHTITIPDLSATHFLLERRAGKIRLYDLNSSNGTYFQGRRLDSSVDLNPGDVFTPMPITLVAMNAEMQRHRPTLVEIVGLGYPPSPDKLMIEATNGSGHVLITGEPGCGHERLAEAMHAMSLRRTEKMIDLGEIPDDVAAQAELVRTASAAKTTVMLSLTAGRPLDPSFGAMLFAPSYGVRVFVVARTFDVARTVLGESAMRQAMVALLHVDLRSLVYRTGEIDQLVDRRLAERGASLRTSDLSPGNKAALRSYRWPRNLAELRQVSDGLAAYVAHENNLRRAAKALGIAHQTLSDQLGRVGLDLKNVLG